MAWCWPPPACPGSHQALLRELGACPPAEELDFGELFAGKGRVGLAMGEAGYRGRALDREHLPAMDFLRPSGMLLALRVACTIQPGGLMWLAPPCDSWVWINRHTAGRDVSIEGAVTSARIVGQNALAERLALLIQLLTQRGVHWIVEQPASTALFDYPAVRDRLQGAQVCRLDMGAFGADSVKATLLVGTAPHLQQLPRTCSAHERLHLRMEGVQTTVRSTDASGRKRCSGTAALKGTQAYPWGFATAHAAAFAGCYGPSRCCGFTSSAEVHVAEVATLLETLPGFLDAWWLRNFLGDPF